MPKTDRVRSRSRFRKQTGRGSLFATAMLAFCVSASADEEGEKLFRACKGCHEIGEGARHKVGPHLDGIIGRKAGSMEGFNYSVAMKKAGEEGLVWDAEKIAHYLEKPRDFIPGNRMSYRGMAKAGDREALVNWLASRGAAAPAADPAARDEAHPAVAGFADAVLKLEGDPEYGEYLAGECVTCHQASGHADGIPSVVGLPKDYFVRALFEYKNNIRSNEVMKLRVANLTNEEIAALAAYFSELKPQ